MDDETNDGIGGGEGEGSGGVMRNDSNCFYPTLLKGEFAFIPE